MKFVEPRPFADPEAVAPKLLVTKPNASGLLPRNCATLSRYSLMSMAYIRPVATTEGAVVTRLLHE
jgi:hypothetical protein